MTPFPHPASFAAFVALALLAWALALFALDAAQPRLRDAERSSRHWGLSALLAALGYAVEAVAGLVAVESGSATGAGLPGAATLVATLLLGAAFLPLARGLSLVCRDGRRLVGTALAANAVHFTVVAAVFGLAPTPAAASIASAVVAGVALLTAAAIVRHPQRPEGLRYQRAIAATLALAGVCALAHALLGGFAGAGGPHPLQPWLALIGSAATTSLPLVHVVRRHRQLSAQVDQSSLLDPLTALFNRRGLAHAWATLEARARRGDDAWHIGVLMLDVDDFKSINARYGQVTGDTVLQIAADSLRQTGRRYDVGCRFDGEQFCMLLPGVTIRQAQMVSDRIRQRFSQLVTERTGVAASLSAGVTVIDASSSTLEEATDTADQMLHAAMRDGRDSSRVDPDAVRVIAGLRPLPQHARRDQFGFPLV